jgi:hypothetical protein
MGTPFLIYHLKVEAPVLSLDDKDKSIVSFNLLSFL